VEEFGRRPTTAKRAKAASPKAEDPKPIRLTAAGEALADQLKEWRATEAKRLGLPAFMVLHDRTLAAVAQARPINPKQLLEISGMGPAKVERFGEAILGLCGTTK